MPNKDIIKRRLTNANSAKRTRQNYALQEKARYVRAVLATLTLSERIECCALIDPESSTTE